MKPLALVGLTLLVWGVSLAIPGIATHPPDASRIEVIGERFTPQGDDVLDSHAHPRLYVRFFTTDLGLDAFDALHDCPGASLPCLWPHIETMGWRYDPPIIHPATAENVGWSARQLNLASLCDQPRFGFDDADRARCREAAHA